MELLKSLVFSAVVSALAAFSPALASAQYTTYAYGGYGSNFSNSGYYGGYNNFSTPYSYGYGANSYGYGANNYYLYRPPSYFTGSNSDDPYHNTSSYNHTERSTRNFARQRQQTRQSKNYYSNDTYRANHPHDSDYYSRTMR